MSNLIREALEAALSELAECSKAVQVQERVREALASLAAPVKALPGEALDQFPVHPDSLTIHEVEEQLEGIPESLHQMQFVLRQYRALENENAAIRAAAAALRSTARGEWA